VEKKVIAMAFPLQCNFQQIQMAKGIDSCRMNDTKKGSG